MAAIADFSSPEWADIKPVYQDDGPSPLCPILYDPSYSSAMDLFRSVVRQGEVSERVLRLTEHIIRINPAQYSLWQYRARILIEKNMDLRAELDFLDVLANNHLKNYQVWQHRRVVVTALGDPTRELSFIASSLARDSKNYHTWAYRQWVLCHFGGLGAASGHAGASPSRNAASTSTSAQGAGAFPELWDGELAFVDQLIEEDVRNNSAWSHRFFVQFASGRAGQKGGQAEKEVAKQEVGYAKAKIAMAPNNASAWNYLRGVLRHISQPLSSASDLARSLVPTSAEALSDPQIDAEGRTPPLALELLLDAIIERLKARGGEEGADKAVKEGTDLISRLKICDPMRKRYWAFRASELRSAAAASASTA